MSDNTKTISAADDAARNAEFENFKAMSPGRLVTRRFFRSQLSILGLVTLVVMFLFSFLGPVIMNAAVGWDEERQTYGYGETEQFPIPRESEMLTKDNFIGPDGGSYSFYDRSVSTIGNKAPPSKAHPLGTDVNSMDIFIRLMYGGRMSLFIAFIVVFLETFLGVVLGSLAGYFGKWVDQLIMRIVDIFICLPTIPILLILSSVLASIESIKPSNRIYYMMAFLTLLGWAGTARLVRGQILGLREQEYMLAAEAAGLPAWRRMFIHLLPNVMPQLIVTMTLGLGGVILYESTLSFLNLGVAFPYAAWGTMIAQADPSKGQEVLAYFPNMWVPPGVMIVMTVLAFNFVGDGLRDAFDPKSRR